jgi:hypothetical protein
VPSERSVAVPAAPSFVAAARSLSPIVPSKMSEEVTAPSAVLVAGPGGPSGPSGPSGPAGPSGPRGNSPALKSFLSSDPFVTCFVPTLLRGSVAA